MDTQSTTKAQRTADAYRAARLQAQQDQFTAGAQRLANAVPFLPELGAAWSAGLRSLDDLSSGRASDFGQRWNQARAEQRGYADEFQREHPVVGNLLGALGMAAPAALASAIPASQGVARPPAPAVQSLQPGGGRIAPTLRRAAGSVAQNATAGALAGAAYGFSQPGTLDQRARSARNAFLPGAAGGGVAPLALGGLVRSASALASAPAVAAAIRRSLSSAPVERTFNDLADATDVEPRAFLGDTASLARALASKNQAAWAEANALPAQPTTNRILEEPSVIHKFGDVMDEMEDEGRTPLRELPVANDYYGPIKGNVIPDFLLQLPTVEAVDATLSAAARRRLAALRRKRSTSTRSGRRERARQGQGLERPHVGEPGPDGPGLSAGVWRQRRRTFPSGRLPVSPRQVDRSHARS